MNHQKTIYSAKPEAPMTRGRELKQCHCGAWFSLPKCHASRHKSCSSSCKDRKASAARSLGERRCEECGIEFTARPQQIKKGQGRFCSVNCSLAETRKRESFKIAVPQRWITRRANEAAGITKRQEGQKGEASPAWKGGPAETRRRAVEKGAQQAYRKANREKVKEWSTRRHGRKTGKLPRGTVAVLVERQRACCAICRTSIKSGYHVDHIMPLALGGKHEPLNIQLLCPTCNVRKNAKHPIRYAQERGMLL